MHCVNRLRHSDFVSLFGHLDFDITECRAMTALDGSDMLSGIPVAGDFNKYDTEDVAITTGVFMLVPRAA